jgi:hypothetical protein
MVNAGEGGDVNGTRNAHNNTVLAYYGTGVTKFKHRNNEWIQHQTAATTNTVSAFITGGGERMFGIVVLMYQAITIYTMARPA